MKKIFLVAITAVAICCTADLLTNEDQSKTSALALANIEALSGDGDEPTKYFVFHMQVFDKYGNTTGKCRANCSLHRNGTHDSCHSHGPENCCS